MKINKWPKGQDQNPDPVATACSLPSAKAGVFADEHLACRAWKVWHDLLRWRATSKLPCNIQCSSNVSPCNSILFIAHLSKWGQAGSCCQAVDSPEGKHPWKKLVSRIATQWEYFRTVNANHANSRAKGTTLLSSISNAINASTPLSTSLIIVSSQISRFNSQSCIKDHTKSIICLKEKTVPTPISSADLRLLTASWKLHVCPASMWCLSLLLTLFAWRLLTHLQVTLEFRIIATLPCHDLRAGPDGS